VIARVPPLQLPEAKVDRLIDAVIEREGGDTYTNDPSDRGRGTRFGVTEATARAFGYAGPMGSLPRDTAVAIYRQRFVTGPGFDQVLAIEPSVGAELVDTGINMGPGTAARFLQRWLNGFNVDGSRYPRLAVDGNVGPVTLDALRAFVRWRGPMGITALLRGLNASQAAHYLDITESDPSQRRFLFGWITNRVEMPS